MKKAAIYVRVSTPDQHVESQLYDLRELAVQKGFEVVHEYEDRGVCGKKARRPGLDALMADARRKKFGVVLVAAFDRIARSTRNFLQIVDELDSLGIEFVSRREGVAMVHGSVALSAQSVCASFRMEIGQACCTWEELMDYFHVFVLTSLSLDKNGEVKSRNLAVTFDLFEAEDHRNKSFENDYETFVVPCDWREDAEQSELVAAMREFRAMVLAANHQHALRM